MRMLNNEKIILMTKLSLYEQNNSKKEIQSSKYFKSDYMLMKMLSSFICVTIAYILALALWIMFSSDTMLMNITTTGKFIAMIVVLVIIYAALTVIYMIFSYAYFSHKFRKIRRNLKEYNGDLKTLHRIQESEYDAIIGELEGGDEK
jgi:uncharacterized membrane protein YdbT with pleckstrin-like domain